MRIEGELRYSNNEVMYLLLAVYIATAIYCRIPPRPRRCISRCYGSCRLRLEAWGGRMAQDLAVRLDLIGRFRFQWLVHADGHLVGAHLPI
jgi:hypothetical protein